MTAVLSPQPPQGASTPSPTQHSPQTAPTPSSPQTQTSAAPTPLKPSPPEPTYSTNTTKSSAKSGHLSAPTSASSPEQIKPSSSRGSPFLHRSAMPWFATLPIQPFILYTTALNHMSLSAAARAAPRVLATSATATRRIEDCPTRRPVGKAQEEYGVQDHGAAMAVLSMA
ncbi:hypothetical protein BDV97DRAFT_167241 [Delphinella strobiligena]|nr:hypothetical protein BDV97DRAFT_167241 [Delphinella strobiligena]